MNPADQVLVQKCLGATLAKVAAMHQNLAAAKKTLAQQEQALYAGIKEAGGEPSVAPVSLPGLKKSPSILEGDADMQKLNDAIKRLTAGCDCPNISK
jgi:hypothetical protein